MIFELWLDDLKEDAQKRLLEFWGYNTEEENNFDICPIDIFERGEYHD